MCWLSACIVVPCCVACSSSSVTVAAAYSSSEGHPTQLWQMSVLPSGTACSALGGALTLLLQLLLLLTFYDVLTLLQLPTQTKTASQPMLP
jgi:hypothetical protein